jgi:hypothetical protein
MKIGIKELRKIVREVLAEEMNDPSRSPTMMAPTQRAPERQTVPAAQSAAEKQFKKDTGGQKWGKPGAIPRSGDNKDARVWNVVVQSMGSQMNDQQRQALRQELTTFLQSKDPSEKLIATAEQLANEFSQSKKSA